MERDTALRRMSSERKSEEYFVWHSFMNETGHVLEPEPLVITGVPYETTALSIELLQP